jgi:type IV pilus assembly protein PilM
MANPRFAWGIDVGNRALKAVKLVRDGSGGLRVDDVDIIEHEHILSDAGDNKEALDIQSLNQFSAKHPERGGAVAIGVSGQSSFARFIKLPPVEDKKIPEIVKFEAIQQIPFPLDDVEWSYQLFQDEGSPEKEVGIFAMRKELVNHTIQNFANAGLNVQAVQMNPLAVYNAMYYDQRIKGTTMIIDVGAENTDLIIAEGEQIWLRSIPVGGNNFTEALIKQFKLKFPKAEELKRNAATSKYTRQILQAMRPVFDSLVAEVQRSIGFYASVHRDSRISRVIALGGTFRLPGLQKFLQMQLQLDVQRFDTLGAAPPPDARVATLLNDNILSVVSPYGLALQAMGEGKISSSLLPLAIQRERMWRDKTKWFAAAAALFVIGSGVAAGRYYYDRVQYAAQENARRQIATELQTAKTFSQGWDEVEKAGEPERKVIASLQKLTKMRELQGKLVAAIDQALPEPAPKPQGKRGERAVVLVDDISSDYYDDLTPALAKTDSGYTMSTNEFISHAFGAGSSRGGGGNTGAHLNAKTLTTGMFGPAPAPTPAADGSTAAAAAPAGKQRGYLMTLTCRTPMQRWTTVAEAVRNALVDQTKPMGKEKQEFRIERVEIVRRDDMKTAPAFNKARMSGSGGAARAAAAAAAARDARNRALGRGTRTGNVSDTMEDFGMTRTPTRTPPGSRFRPGTYPNRSGVPTPPGRTPTPPANGTNPATGQPDEGPITHPMPQPNFDNVQTQNPAFDPRNQPILDPVTGEDASADSRLTLLVAVVLDPAPPAPPPATQPAVTASADDVAEPSVKPAAVATR